jgi:hypothetical protein
MSRKTIYRLVGIGRSPSVDGSSYCYLIEIISGLIYQPFIGLSSFYHYNIKFSALFVNKIVVSYSMQGFSIECNSNLAILCFPH